MEEGKRETKGERREKEGGGRGGEKLDPCLQGSQGQKSEFVQHQLYSI